MTKFVYKVGNFVCQKPSILVCQLHILQESGIQFVLGTEVGKDVEAQQLVDDNDAVLLCCGATKSRSIDVPGNHLKGVYLAMDFLKSNTKKLLDSEYNDNRYISAKEKSVIISGGGDTATDCVATAIRHGCKSVIQFEIMPMPPASRQQDKNPWPEWPLKLKTDYGQEEAIEVYGQDPRQFCVSTKCIKGNEEGEVCGIETMDVIWSKDQSGRLKPIEVLDSAKSWKADLILIAMGFVGPEDTIPHELQLERDARSNVKADFNHYETSCDKVFVAGDMRRGQSLVVWALQEGKLAAAAIDKQLMGSSEIR